MKEFQLHYILTVRLLGYEKKILIKAFVPPKSKIIMRGSADIVKDFAELTTFSIGVLGAGGGRKLFAKGYDFVTPTANAWLLSDAARSIVTAMKG